MGNLTSAIKTNDLTENVFSTTEERRRLKSTKHNLLLEQAENIDEWKKNIASYRVKMASRGITDLADGVEQGFADETKNKNQKLTDSFNHKLKELAQKKRHKVLLESKRFIHKISAP